MFEVAIIFGLLLISIQIYTVLKKNKEKTKCEISQISRAFEQRGITLFKQGRYEEATDAYHEAIRLDQDSSCVLYNRKGDALFKQGRYEEAIEAYREAIRLNPWEYAIWRLGHEAYLYINLSLRKLGRPLDAFEVLKQDTEGCGQVNYWLYKGETELELGYTAAAIQSFRKAIKLEDELERDLYPEDHMSPLPLIRDMRTCVEKAKEHLITLEKIPPKIE